MRFQDFLDMTPRQYAGTARRHYERDHKICQDAWERMRMQAVISLAPYIKKGQTIHPEKLIPLPWDEKKKTVPLSREESKKRYEELMKRKKDGKQ